MSRTSLPLEKKEKKILSREELEKRIDNLEKLNARLREDVKTVYNHLLKAKELNIKLLEDKVKLENEREGNKYE